MGGVVSEGTGVGDGEGDGGGDELVGDGGGVVLGEGLGDGDGFVEGLGDGFGGLVCGGGAGALTTGAGVVVCVAGWVECLAVGLAFSGFFVGEAGTLGVGETGAAGETAAGVAGNSPTRSNADGDELPDRTVSAAIAPPSATMAPRASVRSVRPRNSGPRGRPVRPRRGDSMSEPSRVRSGARDVRAARRNSRRRRPRVRNRARTPRRGGRGVPRRRRRRALHLENGGGRLAGREGERNCTALAYRARQPVQSRSRSRCSSDTGRPWSRNRRATASATTTDRCRPPVHPTATVR